MKTETKVALIAGSIVISAAVLLMLARSGVKKTESVKSQSNMQEEPGD